MILKRLILFGICLYLSACVSNDYRFTNYPAHSFIAQNNRAVNAISTQLAKRDINSLTPLSPLVIATIVKMDDLRHTSPFGRLVTEHVAARFVQLNYNIIEFKLGKAIMMKPDQGDFELTRDVQALVNAVKAKAVVIGTYTDNMNDVYINLKVVNPANSVIIGAHSYAVPKAPNIEDMLIEQIAVY